MTDLAPEAVLAGGFLDASGDLSDDLTIDVATRRLEELLTPSALWVRAGPGRQRLDESDIHSSGAPWWTWPESVRPDAALHGTLRDAWRAVTGFYHPASEPTPILRMTVPSVEDADRLFGLQANVGLRLSPMVERSADRFVWRWPLRIGVTGPRSADWVRRLGVGTYAGELYSVQAAAEIGHEQIEILLVDADDAAGSNGEADLRTTCAIAVGSGSAADLLGRAIDGYRSCIAAGVPSDGADWLKDVIYEMTHDHPIDVAFAFTVPPGRIAGPPGIADLTAVGRWSFAVGTEVFANDPIGAQLEQLVATVPFGHESDGGRASVSLIRSGAARGIDPTIRIPILVAAAVAPPPTPPDGVDADGGAVAGVDADGGAVAVAGVDADGGGRVVVAAGRPEPKPPQPPVDEADPPRTSFARLDCPPSAVVGVEFEIQVGLQAKPDPGVLADPMVRPDSSVGPWTLAVQLVAEGFRLRAGEDGLQQVRVTADAPYPSIPLHLTPEEVDEPIHPALIRALYSADGHTMGLAVRPISVLKDEALAGQAPEAEQPPPVDMGAPPARRPADLTARILLSTQVSNALVWTLETDPALNVPTPGDPETVPVGSDPQVFAQRLENQVMSTKDRQELSRTVVGSGDSITRVTASTFLDVLKKVADAVAPKPPTVLILTEEGYIPWELARIDGPHLIDPAAPPILGAQANVGRWVLSRPPPSVPPPAEVSARTMTVVVGDYKGPTWPNLEHAKEEASELQRIYKAKPVAALAKDVFASMEDPSAAGVLHFSLHGESDLSGLGDGLVMQDEAVLSPEEVRGTALGAPAFVFLNACQVGAGESLLGQYAGMAMAFLVAGASAVIAPLWKIDDEVAKGVALDFYADVFKGASPADVLRTARGKLLDPKAPASSTYLAYQYFGDPALRLTREEP